MTARQDSDNLAWDRSDALWEEAIKHVRSSAACRRIESFAEKMFAKPAVLVTPLIIGGFNVLYPIRIEGLSDNVLIRLPCPNQAVFPEEKTLAEAATAAYVSQSTRIPIPKLFNHGIDPDIGPFMIIQDLGSRRVMGQALEAPREDPSEPAVLRPDISESKLKCLYVKLAHCDDCRTKYVARQLFRRLAKQGRLSSFGFAEDGWPANILIDENDHVLGAIDWEFSYAAPTQFVLDPPWWLLLDVPEMWDDGIDNWTSIYERRLQTWLSAMEEAEQDMGPGSLPLSAYMRESWTTGRFWLNYAARKSWAFDTIYWKYLDERFFGERDEHVPTEELWKTRVHLLNEEERAAMEPLVQTKMEESKERVLIEWDAAEARTRLSSFLFD
ncbi:hypothetical protein ACRALDRAFT_1076671 [Sodiomyces alcalophilus JCM 7366]|uniref:uncharacterized protein n=1 Tax=Sodiomyces alcalophilus JCM 7366 TaxID=591952 RepID=UPI0039B4190B